MVGRNALRTAVVLFLVLQACALGAPVLEAASGVAGVKPADEDCCASLHPGRACPMAAHHERGSRTRVKLTCGCADHAPAYVLWAGAFPPPALAAIDRPSAVPGRPADSPSALDRPATVVSPPPRA